ncbi:hypothetical protein [Pedobacter gandavensis]|uniref:HU domain-containing protein n=1 Tax=Pedobacter gandavensis TaxID=2679963 RepID=UPI00292F07FD|nr:hypothetical protein [Pedobacter gandavensis]
MDMLSYLTVLIKTRKEVGISGLGTIYKKKSPGRYDAATHSFLPPSYVLDFNPELLEQNLLIDHICKLRNISPDSANYFIEQFVKEIKKQLEEHQQASLAPLGTLYQSSEALSFKPLNDQNFGFDFYGLPPVKEELSTSPITEESNNDAIPTLTEEEADQHQLREEQLALENSNADLRDESVLPVIEEAIDEELLLAHEGNEDLAYKDISDIEELSYEGKNETVPEQDEQPVFEEIAEVELPKQPVEQPEIESIGNIEEQPKAVFEEPASRPSINEIYAQTNKPAETPISVSSPIAEHSTENGAFYNSVDEAEGKSGIPIYLKILIAILLILIGLVAAYFIRPDIFDSILKTGKDPITVPLVTENNSKVTDSLSHSDSLENISTINDNLEKDSIVSSATTALTNDSKTAQANAPAPQTGITYEVIGASVANQKEADRFIAQMTTIGLTAKAIPPLPGKKKIKISIATFNDYNSADAQIPALQKKLGIKDLYIHTNKPL